MRWLLLLLAACSTDDPVPAPIDPTANLARDVTATDLAFDIGNLSATAKITFAPSDTPGASLEVGDLTFDSVSIPYAITGKQMDLGVPAYDKPMTVEIAYHFTFVTGFAGPNPNGYTLTWPDWCGNLFPCHSDPTDGTTFTADIEDVPDGKTVVYPQSISIAPAYQFAWAYDVYTELPVGTTKSGTEITIWYRTGEQDNALAGSAYLVAAFDWLEQTIGPYRFGPKFSAVSVGWPRGAYGGIEHHPFVHIDAGALSDSLPIVHEASHGWFGDGIRIACWEDLLLSEGTVSYLAARALDVVAPDLGAQAWQRYAAQLAKIPGSAPVWPQTCGDVAFAKNGVLSGAPYMRGAFFYKGIADKIGADQLDVVLARFFHAHQGQTAGMADMLAEIQADTGYDPTACAQTWLLDTTSPTSPTPGPCP